MYSTRILRKLFVLTNCFLFSILSSNKTKRTMRSIWCLVQRELNKRYAQSLFGAFWIIIKPMIVIASFTFLLGDIGDLSSKIKNYPIFVLSGILPWEIFSTVVINCSNILISNKAIMPKVPINKLSFLIVGIIISAIESSLLLVVGMSLLIFFSNSEINISGIFYSLLISLLLGFSIGSVVSALCVWYRDFRSFVNYTLQLLLLLSPIGFPSNQYSSSLELFSRLNPMITSIDLIRFSVGYPAYANIDLSYTFAQLSIMVLVGLIIFWRMQRYFVDII